MTRKTYAILAAACLGALGMTGTASACSFNAWGAGGGLPAPGTATVTSGAGMLVAGQPTDATAVARYSGKCGSLSKAAGNYVQDGSPGNEPNYRTRFYVHTGLASGTATVFKALSNTAATAIQVDYNFAGNFTFTTPGGNTQVTGIQPNKWYSIELNWTNTNAMSIIVQGANAAAPTNGSISAGGAASNVENVQLGWIAGVGTVSAAGGIITDAFESRRATAIGRLCRGDANNDQAINVFDRGAITGEIAGTALANGQPDCNEDGVINVFDRGCVTAQIAAAAVCN